MEKQFARQSTESNFDLQIQKLKGTFKFISDKFETKDELLELVEAHNSKERYLMFKLLKLVKKIPPEIREQYQKLIDKYESPEEYTKLYQETLKRYETEPFFIDYAKNIYKKLILKEYAVSEYSNYIIYELCSDIISDKVYLEPEKLYLNFHFLQYWIEQQKRIKEVDLTEQETQVIKYFVNSEEYLLERDYSQEEIDIIITKLMEKFKVDKINKLVAAAFLNNQRLLELGIRL